VDQPDHRYFSECIRSTIEAEEIEAEQSKIRVTVSIGLAFTIPTMDKTLAEFFKVANRCLYSAKSDGRNQVVINNYLG
jgi:diguanylate cyclase (GGDEF)-like protein